jgi:DNA-binding beta-propeller fold protein YncE
MKSLLPLFFLSIAALGSASADPGPLTPGNPVELTNTHGKFDFIKVDAARRRLLACHTGNGTLDVIDLDTGKPVASVLTGAAQGVAIDDKGGRYFVSSSKPPQLVIIDAAKLTITGAVPLPSAADVCTYSPTLNRVVVDSDEKPEQWWIDPDAKKIENTVTYPGTGMEDLAFNADSSFLFQNLKDVSQLAKLDPTPGKIVAQWPTTPADKPHGLAMITESNDILIAGGTGKLALIDLTSGKVTASCDTAPRVDELASGTGVISVAYISVNHLAPLGDIPSAPGAHSIAVDPKSHTVWIAYVRGTTPCVQPFTAN